MTIVCLVVPLLLLAVVLAAVWLDRWSVPVILVALGLGIVCGSDVLNLWMFDDFHLANDVANVALVFILFQGGLATKRADLQAVALPAGSPAVGRTLAALGLPRGALVITIARGGEFVVPGGGTEILAGDALLLLANAELAREVE